MPTGHAGLAAAAGALMGSEVRYGLG